MGVWLRREIFLSDGPFYYLGIADHWPYRIEELASEGRRFVYASTVKKYWLFLDVTRVIV
jgi:hypothetical protein